MKAGPRNGSSARRPRVRPSSAARAAAWTAALCDDSARAGAPASRPSSTARAHRRLFVDPRLEPDPAGHLVPDDTLAPADAQADRAERVVIETWPQLHLD